MTGAIGTIKGLNNSGLSITPARKRRMAGTVIVPQNMYPECQTQRKPRGTTTRCRYYSDHYLAVNVGVFITVIVETVLLLVETVYSCRTCGSHGSEREGWRVLGRGVV
jgi:hypothetical protein